jgi:endogenous inhibitor of DNA gyrase (YacG/DUF329 family)
MGSLSDTESCALQTASGQGKFKSMSDQNSKTREVKCPQCGRLALYTNENIFRPFCSERCRTNDLGAWASEVYKIPATPSSNSLGLEDVEFNHEPEEGS